MAKKKVTPKKTRPAVAGKPAKQAPKAASSTGKTSGKTAGQTAGKTAGRPAAGAAGKTAAKSKPAKAAPAAAAPAAAGKTTKKAPAPAEAVAAAAPEPKKKSPPKRSKSAAQSPPAAPAPDSDGYVIINGRRIRMMSPQTEIAAPRRKRPRGRSQAEQPSADKAGDKPVKTKLGKKELDQYRSLLLTQRGELVGDLSAMQAQALQSGGGNLSHMPIHMADIGTDTFDQDFMLGMAETERRRLREIDAALQRIEDRTYGVCEMTSKPIPKARLNAKPWARYTIEAAREIERGLGA